MCGFPVFPASLLLRPGAWISQCHNNGRKTCPVHMCAGQRSVSKHRKLAGCYLIEIQMVVVWYCASALLLSWLTMYFWLICYCLAKATHSTLVKLRTKKNCFYYWNRFLPAESHGVTSVHGLLILNAFWVSSVCAGTSFILMWIATRSGKVFGAAAWSAALGCKSSQIPSSQGIMWMF